MALLTMHKAARAYSTQPIRPSEGCILSRDVARHEAIFLDEARWNSQTAAQLTSSGRNRCNVDLR